MAVACPYAGMSSLTRCVTNLPMLFKFSAPKIKQGYLAQRQLKEEDATRPRKHSHARTRWEREVKIPLLILSPPVDRLNEGKPTF